MIRWTLAALAFLVLGCDGTAPKTVATNSSQTAVQPQPESAPRMSPDEQLLADLTADFGHGDELWATFHTTAGQWDCELFWKKTPRAASVFIGLATGKLPWIDPETNSETRRPFYDGTTFFRVIPHFLIQGGDRTNTGEGGPGFLMPDELVPEIRFDQPGALAFANNGPNANGSQFFITLSPAPHLNDRHTIFGHCPELSVPNIIANTPIRAGETHEPPLTTLNTLRFERRFSGQGHEK